MRLAAHMQLSEHVFIERYTHLTRNRAGLSLVEKEDGSCIFLDGALCAVYPARPQQCQDFGVRWFLPGCRADPEYDKGRIRL